MDAPAEFAAIWPALSEDERRVLAALLDHWGVKNAIHVPALAAQVGIPMRRLQEIVADLAVFYGVRIAASLSCGYFIIETPAEADAVFEHLMSRSISGLRHARAIKRTTDEEFHRDLDRRLGAVQLFDHGGASR
jgi:hypothetical protein